MFINETQVMTTSKQVVIDQVLIVLAVLSMVTAGVQVGYFLIFSTITQSQNFDTVLRFLVDLRISWKWFLPFVAGIGFLWLRGLVSGSAED